MTISKELLDELLKGCERPEDLLGDAGLMKELKIKLMERMLGAELTAHLGYEEGKEAPPGQPNRRNGTAGKRLKGQDVVVENCLAREDAVREAGRCLNCGVNTIFDGEKCVLCGGCVDVCPQKCLRIVSAVQLEGAGAKEAAERKAKDAAELKARQQAEAAREAVLQAQREAKAKAERDKLAQQEAQRQREEQRKAEQPAAAEAARARAAALEEKRKAAARDALKKAQRFVLFLQNIEERGYGESDRDYGSIGYGGDLRGDLSNLQFAVDALRRTELDPQHEALQKALVFLLASLACQR